MMIFAKANDEEKLAIIKNLLQNLLSFQESLEALFLEISEIF